MASKPNLAGEQIRLAVRLSGGLFSVSTALGRCYQAIGHWYKAPTKMDAVLTRRLSALSGYQVPVSAMRPDIFGGLTVKELGYTPAQEPAQ